MSELLDYGGGSPRPRSETIVNRLLWIVIGLLALFLAGEILFHLVIGPRLTVTNIRVRSSLALSKEEIMAMAGLGPKQSFFGLDTRAVQRRLEACPMVRSAVVHKRFPDTLELSLQGRQAVSLAFYQAADGRSVPVAIDEEGVVFQIGATVTDWDLPVLTGVQFRELSAGMRLPESVVSVLTELRALQEAEPGLFDLISEVRLVARTANRRELLLYPVHEPVRLRLGPTLQASALRNAMVVLDILARQGLAAQVRELDLRTGEVVYTMREE